MSVDYQINKQNGYFMTEHANPAFYVYIYSSTYTHITTLREGSKLSRSTVYHNKIVLNFELELGFPDRFCLLIIIHKFIINSFLKLTRIFAISHIHTFCDELFYSQSRYYVKHS